MNISDDDESITFSPVDDHIIANNDDYFQNENHDMGFNNGDGGEGEGTNDLNYNKKKVTDAHVLPPQTHAVDASFCQNNSGSNSSISNSLSLLQRIQQAKKQKHSYGGNESDSMQGDDFMNLNTHPFENYTASSSAGVASNERGDYAFTISDDFDNENHDERTTLAEIEPSGNVHMNFIPDYSASDNIRNDHYSSLYEDSGRSTGGHQLLGALTTVGNAIGSTAKSVFHLTRNLYNNNNNRQSQGLLASQQRMQEMDDQHQMLLLDPHDVEDGTFVPMEHGSPFGLRSSSGSGGSATMMMMMGSSNNSSSRRCHPLIGCVSQFCVDVKDIFMGLSRNKKLAVIAFVAFLLWLFISEERQHHHTVSQF